ncbi:MAG: exosortase system-associated protein, TIGR04073 family [Lentisphaerae bacterium]|nr:exosortase system-associated protein, TIGR04073 family [Lentisphaerota bacterium]
MKDLRMKKALKLFLVMFMFTVVAAPAMAVEEYDESGPLTKLSRGIANVAFSPLELLKHPYDVNKNMGAIPGITYGVLRGVCFTVARIGVGVIDIVTFPIPLPGCKDDPEDHGWGYGPLMRPAWVMDLEHNAFGFFYEESVIAN